MQFLQPRPPKTPRVFFTTLRLARGTYAANTGLSWCHMSSTDLVHWTEHEPAMYPTSNTSVDPCEPTVVDTGSISMMPDGRAFMIYATVNASSMGGAYDGNVCAAISTDSHHSKWKRLGRIIDNPTCGTCSASCPQCTAPGSKFPNGCVASPAGCETPIQNMIPHYGFRDPTTPYLAPCTTVSSTDDEDLCWYVVIGSGTTTGRKSAGLLYRSQSSTDVTSMWTFVSVLLSEDAGAAFEQYQYSCPDFFRLPAPGSGSAVSKTGDDGTWVWMSLFPAFQAGNADHADIYYVGKLDATSHTFQPSAATPFTSSNYTPTSRFGHKIAKSAGGEGGRRLIWGAICGLPNGAIPNPRSSIIGAAATHGGCTGTLL